MSNEAEKVDLILAGFTADSPLTKLSNKFDVLASKIENKIGDYCCRLCKEVYPDAFGLAQHR